MSDNPQSPSPDGLVSCPRCRQEAAQLTGSDAHAVLRQGLSYLNARRAGRRRAEEAAQLVDHAGGPDRLIRDVARRGKFLWLELDTGEALLVHLGMSGQLVLQPPDADAERHLRVRIGLDGLASSSRLGLMTAVASF